MTTPAVSHSSTENNAGYAFGYRGLVFNGLFVVYLLVGQPVVVEAAADIFQNETKHIPFGVLLVVVMVLEALVLPRKMRDVFARSEGDMPKVIFLVWVFHMVVSVLLGIQASLAFGINVDRSFFMPIIVIKELALGTTLIRPDKQPAPLSVREALRVDLGLLVFSCIAYSAIWEAGVGRFSLHLPTAGWYDIISFFVLAPLLVFMIILPIRLPFFAEEWIADQSRRGTINIVLSFTVLVVIALAPSIQTEAPTTDLQGSAPNSTPIHYEVAAIASTCCASCTASVGETDKPSSCKIAPSTERQRTMFSGRLLKPIRPIRQTFPASAPRPAPISRS